MSNLSQFLGGGSGAGAPVNLIAQLYVGGQTLYTDEIDGVWLKTGYLIDADETTYPDAYVLRGDMSTAIYDNINKNAQGPTAYAFTFSSDGLKLYNSSNFYNRLFQQSLTVPFDLSTLVSSSGSYFDYSSLFSSTYGIAINPDGTRFFIADYDNSLIYQFNLSTPYDITTASVAGTFNHSTGSTGMLFANNGTKMYLTQTNTVREYNLSTPYQITTASFVQSQNMNISGLSINSYTPAMNPQGTKFYALSRLATDRVYQFSLTTPFDITTAVYDETSFSVGAQVADNWGLYVNSDLNKFFVLDNSLKVYQYSMSEKMGTSINTGNFDYLKLK